MCKNHLLGFIRRLVNFIFHTLARTSRLFVSHHVSFCQKKKKKKLFIYFNQEFLNFEGLAEHFNQELQRFQ